MTSAAALLRERTSVSRGAARQARDAESPLYQSDGDLSAAVRGGLAALDGHFE
jgi:hypothetical protein